MTLKPSIKEALKEAPAKNSAKKLKGACLCVTKKRAEDRGKVLQYIPRQHQDVPLIITASNVWLEITIV
jgi:hypothetical protein